MILNFGSINIDHVYGVDHFVQPGESKTCPHYQIFAGGKGFNQSIAIARSGAKVSHVGLINANDKWLKALLFKDKVNIKFLETRKSPTGHAMIQVDKKGENCIIIYGGANKQFDKKFIEGVFLNNKNAKKVLLQNEINEIKYIINCANRANCNVYLNPSPFTADLLTLDLHKINMLILNEIECKQMGQSDNLAEALKNIIKKNTEIEVLLTKGKAGVIYAKGQIRQEFNAFKVAKPVDTTAAGDTFTGYFLGCLEQKLSIPDSIIQGMKAAAICIQKKGAADSIPHFKDVKKHPFRNKNT